jgi:hypothetical protein
MTDTFTVPENDNPAYAYKDDPTEIVKAALLSCFNSGVRWSVVQVVPHFVAPDRPGWKVLLAVRWTSEDPAGADGYRRSSEKTEAIEVQITKLPKGALR